MVAITSAGHPDRIRRTRLDDAKWHLHTRLRRRAGKPERRRVPPDPRALQAHDGERRIARWAQLEIAGPAHRQMLRHHRAIRPCLRQRAECRQAGAAERPDPCLARVGLHGQSWGAVLIATAAAPRLAADAAAARAAPLARRRSCLAPGSPSPPPASRSPAYLHRPTPVTRWQRSTCRERHDQTLRCRDDRTSVACSTLRAHLFVPSGSNANMRGFSP